MRYRTAPSGQYQTPVTLVGERRTERGWEPMQDVVYIQDATQARKLRDVFSGCRIREVLVKALKS